MKKPNLILFCASVFAVVVFFTGCGNANLPESYGIFAVDGGKPIPLKEGEEAKNFSPKVEFIIFDKTVSFGAAGGVKIYNVPLKPKIQGIDDGSFSWEKWGKMTENYSRDVSATLAGIPSDAVEVGVVQKPIEKKPEMVRIGHSTPLEPGLYQLGRIPFFVDKEGLKSRSLQAARSAVGAGQLQVAYENASVVLKLEPGNTEMQKALDAVFENASKGAMDAVKAKEWKKAALSAMQALQVRPDDKALRSLLFSLPYLNAIQSARDAFAAKDWAKALVSAEKAAQLKRDDTEVQNLIVEIQYAREVELAERALSQSQWAQVVVHAGNALTFKSGDKYVTDLQRNAIYKKGMQLASQAFEQRKFDQALDNLDDAFSNKPDDVEASALEEKVKAAIRLEPRYFGKLFRTIKCFQASGQRVSTIVFSQNGKRAITGGETRCDVWDGEFERNAGFWEGDQQGSFAGRNGVGSMSSPAVSSDGNRVAFKKQSGVVAVLDIKAGKSVAEFPPPPRPFNTRFPSGWALSGDGTKLAVSQSGVAVYDVQNLTTPICKTPEWNNSAGALCFTEDGNSVVIGLSPVALMDARTGQLVRKIPGNQRQISEMQFSPDGKKIALVQPYFDGGLKIIDTETGGEIFGFRSGNPSFAISPDWKIIARDTGGRIDFIDIVSGEKLGSRPLGASITTLAFTPDGKRLYTGTDDGRVYLWGVEDTDANRKQGMSTLNNAIVAHGGPQNIAKWKAARVKYKMVETNPGGDLTISMEEQLWQFPGQFRWETRRESQGKTEVWVTCVNGDAGWRNNNGQVELMNKETVAGFLQWRYNDWMMKLFPLLSQKHSITALPETKGFTAINVESRGQPDVRLYFNQASGLLAVRGMTVRNQGEANQQWWKEEFSDYRELEGVKYPARIKGQREKPFEIEIQEVEFFEKIDGARFSKDGAGASGK